MTIDHHASPARKHRVPRLDRLQPLDNDLEMMPFHVLRRCVPEVAVKVVRVKARNVLVVQLLRNRHRPAALSMGDRGERALRRELVALRITMS